jgi:hypothetical protein
MLLLMMGRPSFADFAARLQTRWALSYAQIEQQIKDDKLQKKASFPQNPKPFDHQYIWLIGTAKEGPVNVVLRRTQALLDEIALMPKNPNLSVEQAALNAIKAKVSGVSSDKTIFNQVCELQRKIAMQNPLLDFDTMIFNCFQSQNGQFHGQQIAWYTSIDGGAGLYKVSGFKEGNPVYTDMLATAKVINGRFKDKILSNSFSEWDKKATFFTPEVSYDAKKIAFAWAPHAGGAQDNNFKYNINYKYRIFELDIPSDKVRMLTDFSETGDGGTRAPNMDEYDPTYLPNGRLLWVSERHNGGQRCGNRATSGNMYTMNPTGGTDNMGSDIVRISWHETNERSPAVDYNGKIVYSRWDYIDRHAYSAQSMWLTNPDGSDPRVYHGNYIEDDKPFHPISECDIRPIPKSGGKYVAIASGHHIAYIGNLCVIDINKAPQDSQIRWFWAGGITPGDHPEVDNAKLGHRKSTKVRLFATPYPLNEKFVIVADSSEVLLLDEFRNEILLFTNEGLSKIGVHSPLPLKPRSVETDIAAVTCQGKTCDSTNAQRATISVINVYNTDTPWPATVKINHLRICQLVPRPKKPWDTERNEWWGWSDGALLKAVIGTVPVEKDGSAYFQAPIEREIFFQAVDSTGMAVTSMLSGTYVHPGEHLTCLGCHEDKWKASPSLKNTVTHALQKGPAPITQEVSGSYPLTYARLVYKEVFLPKCWEACHKRENPSMDFSYWKVGSKCDNGAGKEWYCVGALEKFVTYYGAAYESQYGYTKVNMLRMGFPGDKPEKDFVRPNASDYGALRSRSVPMRIGARACALTSKLYRSHHGVNLTPVEFRRAVMWMDLNSQELGTYQFSDNADYTDDQKYTPQAAFTMPGPHKRQRDGLVVWPSWEGSGFDSTNVVGVQRWGKLFRPYNPDLVVGAGSVSMPGMNCAMQLMVRGGQLVLAGVPWGSVQVALYNLAGRVVIQKTFSGVQDGVVSLASTRQIGSGSYVARISVHGEQQQLLSQPILITRY